MQSHESAKSFTYKNNKKSLFYVESQAFSNSKLQHNWESSYHYWIVTLLVNYNL